MIVMVAFIALGVDIGYLQNARVELQKAADAAAMAAAWEFADSSVAVSTQSTNARNKAAEFAAANPVCKSAPSVDLNLANMAGGDIVVGYLANPSDPNATLDTTDPTKYNAVQIRIRRTSSQNGEVPMFFGRALGLNSVASQATATAAMMKNFAGFKTPSGSDKLNILPFALDKETWDNLMAGVGTDNWRWDPSTKQVVSGSDGVKEVNLYPQSTGSSGNRGTVDVGGSNNSTADLARQITEGVSASDMQALGKPLKFDDNGKLTLNGDTGISAGVKDELTSIIGQTKVIPIFESVVGPGNNATYTIVAWVGVRVLDVNLTGKMSNKRLMIQPANVIAKYGISDPGTQKSWYVYSPAWLVR